MPLFHGSFIPAVATSLAFLLLPACSAKPAPAHSSSTASVPESVPSPPGPAASPETPADENDSRWHEFALGIAQNYERWMRVDNLLRWAPLSCSLPLLKPELSAAGAGTPHARKLYVLYALDAEAYGAKPTAEWWADQQSASAEWNALENQLQQVLVKEAWQPVENTLAPDHVDNPTPFPREHPPIQRDGRWFHAGPRAGLFLIFRPTQPIAPTDEGWVYATVSPEGEVTGAGRMASCMECHTRQADRLFGLPD